MAWRLELPELELFEQERQIEAVLRWLRAHQRWLLVVDNLDQPVVESLRHWLPNGLPGHLIITSRSPQGSARPPLRPLPLDVAVSFPSGLKGKPVAFGKTWFVGWDGYATPAPAHLQFERQLCRARQRCRSGRRA